MAMLPTEEVSLPKKVYRRFVRDGDKPLTMLQIHCWSIFLGLVTGLMGAAYSEMLDMALKFLWRGLPKAFLTDTSWLYAPVVCGVGGMLVGLLGKLLGKPGGIDDWITKIIAGELVPPSTFFSMLFLSLVTASTGFSVGPEAPMVCMGSIVASILMKRVLSSPQPGSIIRTLNLAGASGALSAFFAMPLVGAVFVLELPHKHSMEYYEAFSPCVVSSIAASLAAKAVSDDQKFKGQFSYAQARPDYPVRQVGWPVLAGVVAAVIAVIAVWLKKKVRYHFVQPLITVPTAFLPVHDNDDMDDEEEEDECHCSPLYALPARYKKSWKMDVAVKTFIGIVVGALAVLYPQTLWWGELTLQSAIDRQKTPLWLIGRQGPLMRHAIVDPRRALGQVGAVQVALAKLVAIVLASASGFPGGVIFPFFFVGATFAKIVHGFTVINVETTCTLCLMAALQAAITRTPFATILLIVFTTKSFDGGEGGQFIAALLPFLVVAVSTSMLIVHTLDCQYLSAQTGRGLEQHSPSDDVSLPDATGSNNPMRPASARVSMESDASAFSLLSQESQQQQGNNKDEAVVTPPSATFHKNNDVDVPTRMTA